MNAMDLISQVKAVKSNVVTAKTTKMYLRGISRYLLWLYENKRNVLSDAFMQEVDPQYQDTGATMLSIDSILRFMSDNPTVPPIEYELHQAEDFEQFIMSLKNRKGEKPGQFVYDSMRSSLFHLYRGYGRTMPVEFAADLTVFFKGLKRTVARRKHESGDKLTEGKEPLPFPVLQALCLSMLKHDTDEFVFAHLFLIISWNLMCRAGNTAGIRLGHMSWDGDALAFYSAT